VVEAVRIPGHIIDEMIAHARAGYPNEACGVLAAAGGYVVKHYRTANAAASPYMFEIAAQEELAIWNELDEHDWSLYAIYHSHTRSPAYPSQTDVGLAHFPGTFYILISLENQDAPDVRAYTIEQGAISEVPLIREEP
jgi:proteasome lid subunit RPN8/RPN11